MHHAGCGKTLSRRDIWPQHTVIHARDAGIKLYLSPSPPCPLATCLLLLLLLYPSARPQNVPNIRSRQLHPASRIQFGDHLISFSITSSPPDLLLLPFPWLSISRLWRLSDYDNRRLQRSTSSWLPLLDLASYVCPIIGIICQQVPTDPRFIRLTSLTTPHTFKASPLHSIPVLSSHRRLDFRAF